MTRSASAAPRKDLRSRTWYFVADAGVGPDGKRRQAKRRGFPTKKAAQEALDKLRTGVADGIYVPPAKVTFGDYLDGWITSLPTRGLRSSTIDGYRRNVLYVPAGLRARRLDKVTPGDLNRLYSDLLASGLRQRQGGLSPRSVRYVHVVLSKALSDAVEEEILARNVATKATPPTPKSTKPKEPDWWRPAELDQFLLATANEALGNLIRVAAMTGMRRGEVCGLRWEDVDLAVGRIEVRQQLTTINGDLIFSERTKTDNGRRSIDLDPATVTALRRERKRQAENRLATGEGYQDGGRDLVFTRADGEPLDPESVAKVFDRRVARYGLRRIRFHDLRHTHVAHLIKANVPALVISRRMGHASTTFTMDQYGHLFEEADAEAASAVAALVDGATG